MKADATKPGSRALFAALWMLIGCIAAGGPSYAGPPPPADHLPTVTEIERQKRLFDDPRPHLTYFGPGALLSKELYARLTFDPDVMKRQWADLVGLTAPEQVGKIAPEIKPGKYTYRDLDKFPGLRELMHEELLRRIKPGGPPFAGSIPEFEIIPTRQYYWALPIAEATRKHIGKARLDGQGYLIPGTWEAGYPFPRPEGRFKAQQIMYNVEKRYVGFGLDNYYIGRIASYTGALRMDFQGAYTVRMLRLAGRCLMEPYGFLDDAAKQRQEAKAFALTYTSPRDLAGAVQTGVTYLDPEKPDTLMVYQPSARRARKLAPRDTQDDLSGNGRPYDDWEGFMQKLSPARYPYRYEVIGEREYLVPAATTDGAEYVASQGAEFRNVRLERRPVYVVRMTQLDPGYMYGARVFYIDKETFLYHHIENYGQKGRLYRTRDMVYSFFPDMGAFSWESQLIKDYLNMRSNFEVMYTLPARWGRGDVDIDGFLGAK